MLSCQALDVDDEQSQLECEHDVIRDRIAPQLATLVSSPPAGVGWACEIKLDGYRILARVEGGSVHCYTRNGNDWTAKMPRLRKELAGFGRSAALHSKRSCSERDLPGLPALTYSGTSVRA